MLVGEKRHPATTLFRLRQESLDESRIKIPGAEIRISQDALVHRDRGVNPPHEGLQDALHAGDGLALDERVLPPARERSARTLRQRQLRFRVPNASCHGYRLTYRFTFCKLEP